MHFKNQTRGSNKQTIFEKKTPEKGVLSMYMYVINVPIGRVFLV